MSGGEQANATKEAGSAEKSGEIVVEGARKIEEKSGQCDSTKIEFKADKDDETSDGELLQEVTARDVTPQNSEREDDRSGQKKSKSSESCSRESVVTAENYCDDVREYDADMLSTWSQSTGSVSYDSGWSLHSLIKNLTFNARRADLQPVLPLMQAEKKQVASGLSPSMVNLNEHMLSEMNNALRWRSHLGDMHTHIAITNKKSPNERRGIIAKPELHYPNYRSLSSMSAVCQPMPSFSHCSITDHVRNVRRGHSQTRLLDSVTSSE
ncbi:hypothetical protein Tcan_11069 [Toxocara canis]|uniref:Uncharacterized protein n=1 Tax=Toxocara canis TaxID=6265 RepID=A0A0B2W6J3_TOXCA|nr:hypothetical protein Tcan_11069 [Toxocara canis]